jgi:hypothetical protein
MLKGVKASPRLMIPNGDLIGRYLTRPDVLGFELSKNVQSTSPGFKCDAIPSLKLDQNVPARNMNKDY